MSLPFFSALAAFAQHFAVALGVFALFLVAYSWSTPHDELEHVRRGNTAAALGLVGAAIGFAIPLSRAISIASSPLDTLLWGIVALAVQVIGHLALRSVLPRLFESIEKGELASGTVKAGAAICLGLVNAACMTP